MPRQLEDIAAVLFEFAIHYQPAQRWCSRHCCCHAFICCLLYADFDVLLLSFADMLLIGVLDIYRFRAFQISSHAMLCFWFCLIDMALLRGVCCCFPQRLFAARAIFARLLMFFQHMLRAVCHISHVLMLPDFRISLVDIICWFPPFRHGMLLTFPVDMFAGICVSANMSLIIMPCCRFAAMSLCWLRRWFYISIRALMRHDATIYYRCCATRWCWLFHYATLLRAMMRHFLPAVSFR